MKYRATMREALPAALTGTMIGGPTTLNDGGPVANPTRGTAHRLAAALSALLVCLGLVGGATPARAADAPTLKVAIVSEIDSFNPFTTIFAS